MTQESLGGANQLRYACLIWVLGVWVTGSTNRSEQSDVGRAGKATCAQGVLIVKRQPTCVQHPRQLGLLLCACQPVRQIINLSNYHIARITKNWSIHVLQCTPSNSFCIWRVKVIVTNSSSAFGAKPLVGTAVGSFEKRGDICSKKKRMQQKWNN